METHGVPSRSLCADRPTIERLAPFARMLPVGFVVSLTMSKVVDGFDLGLTEKGNRAADDSPFRQRLGGWAAPIVACALLGTTREHRDATPRAPILYRLFSFVNCFFLREMLTPVADVSLPPYRQRGVAVMPARSRRAAARATAATPASRLTRTGIRQW